MNSPDPLNPYAASEPQMAPNSSVFPYGGGLVGQVMVIGILQIVLGVLELMMSLLLGFYAVVFAIIPNKELNNMPPEGKLMLSIGFGIAGAVILVFALLRIFSGIYSFKFQRRTMMLVSLIGGMITIGTCYCALFSVGIGIYGMIVMFDPAVKQAYALAASGMPVEEIKARAARARYGF